MIGYRREIDGLRAVAVLPVILFHAGFGAFGGGFVGVDVFFVISGYLITSIILSEKQAGTFSLVRFYERRARRILPALFLVMAASVVLAWMWSLPDDMTEFSRSLAAVSVFSSNILFWQESGYFDTAAELKPLLHTWSLAVEEQYYVLFPPLILMVWGFGVRRIAGILSLGALASLALAQWGAFARPSATFFLLPTRGWELAIGALIAIYLKDRPALALNSGAAQALSLAGLLLIALAVFAYDSATPFPSLYALVPTIGAALILLFATPANAVGRLLGSNVLVGVGLISYSAYLWHQPLFAFARKREIGDPSTAMMMALAAVAIVLAYLSWRFVERPFRRSGTVTRAQVFYGALAGTVLFFVVGLVGSLNGGFPSRYDMPSELAGSFERTRKLGSCFSGTGLHVREDWLCDVGDIAKPISFVMFGDLHAASLYEVFDQAAKEDGQRGVFVAAGGCTPFLGIHALRGDQAERNCNLLNQRVLDFVKTNAIGKIVLIARWTYYTDGGYDGTNFSYIGLDPSDTRSRDVSRDAFARGLENTVNEYARMGVQIYLIAQIPQQLADPKKIFYRAMSGRTVDAGIIGKLSIGSDEHRRLQDFTSALFRQHTALHLVSFDDILCAGLRCAAGDQTGSFYFDKDHLSLYGASRLKERVRELLR